MTPTTANPQVQAPIVITGVHRSGTTMVAELLGKMGVFLGSKLDPNGEAYFFLRLNEWVMRRAGGAWDYPLPTVTFLDQERFFEDTLAILNRHVRSFRFAEFAGYLPYLFSSRSADGNWLWGWKDPRTIFTFRLWNRLFPQARLIYVRRNGVDVASSLAVRERGRRQGNRRDLEHLRIRPLIGRLRDALPGFESFADYLFTTRCSSLEEGFRLWEEYVREGETLFANFPGPKLDLQYEAFLERPERHLEQLAVFCGLNPSPAEVRELAGGVRKGRAFAFLGQEELRRFYDQVKGSELMQRLGYGNLTGA